MKKIVLSIAAMMMFTVSFAGNGEKNSKSEKAAEVTALTMNKNYDMTVNYRTLATTLGLDKFQMEAVELIHDKFVDEMKEAGVAEQGDRKRMVENAANKELQYMGYVLSDKQQRKFTMLLNLTLSNRGLLD